MMQSDVYLANMREHIEENLRDCIDGNLPDNQFGYAELKKMLLYHMGWQRQGKPSDGGKRIRPLLVLLSAACYSDNWQAALPAASAVELIHNFSLIHDDIEDNSDLRRGRATVWKRWGVPQAINAGDLMFSIAQKTCSDLKKTVSPETVLKIIQILNKTCIELTKGQYLDMAFEIASDISQEQYFKMIQGKTASLISCSCYIGALAGESNDVDASRFAAFGQYLGLAFQVMDDWLGIWGDEAVTGKSAESDLVVGKKTLPVIMGLESIKEFREKYTGQINDRQLARDLTEILEREGIKDELETETANLTQKAIAELSGLNLNEQPMQVLIGLANQLSLRYK